MVLRGVGVAVGVVGRERAALLGDRERAHRVVAADLGQPVVEGIPEADDVAADALLRPLVVGRLALVRRDREVVLGDLHVLGQRGGHDLAPAHAQERVPEALDALGALFELDRLDWR